MMNRLSSAINRIEHAIGFVLGHRFPPGSIGGAFALDFDGYPSALKQKNSAQKPFSLRDLVGDGFLWGVPKTRRPIEKRLSRRFGYPDRNYKMIVPKTNIVMCPNCGHDYEVTRLCGNCYEKVKIETKEMQEAIKAHLKLDPVEKEVVVIYENEKEKCAQDFWKNQRLVEMPKKRPDWFHSNLQQSTTQEPSDSKEVKPTELA